MPYITFINGDLCDNGVITHDTELHVDSRTGTIVDRIPHGMEVKIVDLQGNILAPGFLDIQNNGIYGLNFSALNETSTEADIAHFKAFYNDAMAKYLKTGVTALCPTVTLNFPEVYEKVLPLYRKLRLTDKCDSLGAHLEGPFISPAKKGCHPVETFVTGQTHNISEVYGLENLHQNVAIITAAPEIPGVLDVMADIAQNTDVVVSIGHTASDHATCIKAVESGATMITHLYNAMPQPHHREAGVVGLITEPKNGTKQPFYGLICDGVHVTPSMCVMAYRANPDRCVLVTDAMHLIGLEDGTYQWDKQRIVKQGAALYLEGTKTLAGAATDLAVCIQNLVRWANISLAEAVKTVTNNAAASLGISTKGNLSAGSDADLVVLDAHGNVKLVYKLGVEVNTRPKALQASL